MHSLPWASAAGAPAKHRLHAVLGALLLLWTARHDQQFPGAIIRISIVIPEFIQHLEAGGFEQLP